MNAWSQRGSFLIQGSSATSQLGMEYRFPFQPPLSEPVPSEQGQVTEDSAFFFFLSSVNVSERFNLSKPISLTVKWIIYFLSGLLCELNMMTHK